MKFKVRYSMRTLAIAFTFLCIAIGTPIAYVRHASKRQRLALESLNALHVEGEFASEFPASWLTKKVRTWIDRDAFRKVTGITIAAEATDLEQIAKLLPKLNGLEYIHNQSPSLTDVHLQQLSRVSTLRQLILSKGKYSTEGLRPLLKRDHWIRLQAPGAVFDDDMLAQLAQMKDLRFLSFNASKTTLEGFESLSNCRMLQGLVVIQMQNVGDAIQRLNPTTSLDTLDIQQSSISQEDIENISNLAQLKVLAFERCVFRGSSLDPLTKIAGLRFIDLSHTPLTPNQVSFLERFKGLRSIRLHGGVSESNIESLLQSSPTLGLLGFTATDLTDEGLQKVAVCRTLDHLFLPKDTKCTVNGIRKLQEKSKVKVSISDDLGGTLYLPGGIEEALPKAKRPQK